MCRRCYANATRLQAEKVCLAEIKYDIELNADKFFVGIVREAMPSNALPVWPLGERRYPSLAFLP